MATSAGLPLPFSPTAAISPSHRKTPTPTDTETQTTEPWFRPPFSSCRLASLSPDPPFLLSSSLEVRRRRQLFCRCLASDRFRPAGRRLGRPVRVLSPPSSFHPPLPLDPPSLPGRVKQLPRVGRCRARGEQGGGSGSLLLFVSLSSQADIPRSLPFSPSPSRIPSRPVFRSVSFRCPPERTRLKAAGPRRPSRSARGRPAPGGARRRC